MRMQNGVSHTEKQFGKFLSTYNPDTPHLGIYPREMKTWSYKHHYANVYGSFIYNYQKQETEMPFNCWMDK